MTATTLPGAKGTDLLVLLWEEEGCVYRPVAGLVGAAGGGAVPAREDTVLEGDGIVRDRATARLFERLARDAVMARWLVRDTDGGQVEGRYRVAAFSAGAQGSHEIPCTLTLAPAPATVRRDASATAREVVC